VIASVWQCDGSPYWSCVIGSCVVRLVDRQARQAYKLLSPDARRRAASGRVPAAAAASGYSVIEVSTASGRLRTLRLGQAVTRIAWPSVVTDARRLARLMLDRALVGFGDLLRRRELAGSDAKGVGQRPHGAR
jgi:hypothetical protein